MSPCQKLGLVTRNQAGNESIAGLEAGKYNIDWKLECRKEPCIEAECPS